MAYQFEPSGQLKAPSQAELEAADETTMVIVLDYGVTDEGEPYWVYVGVKPSKYQAFLEATSARRAINPEDYGIVLRYGFDAAVPDDVKETMKREHDFDEAYLEKLTAKLKRAQSEFLAAQEAQRIEAIVTKLKHSGN